MRHVQSELGDDDPNNDEDRPFAEEEYDEEEVSEQDEEGEDEEDTLVNAKDLFDEVSTDLPTISSLPMLFPNLDLFLSVCCYQETSNSRPK